MVASEQAEGHTSTDTDTQTDRHTHTDTHTHTHTHTHTDTQTHRQTHTGSPTKPLFEQRTYGRFKDWRILLKVEALQKRAGGTGASKRSRKGEGKQHRKQCAKAN